MLKKNHFPFAISIKRHLRHARRRAEEGSRERSSTETSFQRFSKRISLSLFVSSEFRPSSRPRTIGSWDSLGRSIRAVAKSHIRASTNPIVRILRGEESAQGVSSTRYEEEGAFYLSQSVPYVRPPDRFVLFHRPIIRNK